MTRLRTAALAMVALLAVPVAAAYAIDAERLRALGLGGYSKNESPPAFTTRIAGGGRVSLSELRGKVVLVTFWATWCLECRDEMAMFEQLHRELGTAGLVIVGVNVREAAGPIVEYARTHGLCFPLALDQDGKVGAAYGVVALPTTFLIGRDGRAVARAIGSRAWSSESARSLLRALLAEAS